METFLPSVFKLGEFDWWWVPPDKRAVLAPLERSALEDLEAEHEVILRRILGTLDGYFFGDVDVDVWRNVYQHYLPMQERPKLGGSIARRAGGIWFWTERVCFWKPGTFPEKTFIDPAAAARIVAAALFRLLIHFSTEIQDTIWVAKGNGRNGSARKRFSARGNDVHASTSTRSQRSDDD
jgi:hypothetical protein